MTLPPQVSSGDFAQAVRAFQAVVGADWIFTSAEDLGPYADSYSPFTVEPALQKLPSAAVAPTTVEQVQQIVRIANKYRIPLYTISTGRNLGYGGSSPAETGSVIVDLKRMNRVIEVDEQQAIVVVEPGVNFIELYRYFEEHDTPFMVSSPEPGWGGPVGNALDHGISYVMGDNFAAARGIEVVLPDGEILRTGMGALPNSRIWHDFPYGFGPNINGMFSQSNFGIVTKMGFSLVRKPERQLLFTVTSERSEDLIAMIELVQRLRYEGLLYLSEAASPLRWPPPAPPGARVPAHFARARELLSRRDGGSHDEWSALSRTSGVAISSVCGNIRGPAKIVEATLDHVRAEFAKIAGTKFLVALDQGWPLSLDAISPDERIKYGVPSLWPFSALAMGDTRRGMYFFSPVCRATGEDLFAFRQTVREIVLDHADPDMREPYLGWIMANTVYPKAYIFTYPFPIHDDAAVNAKYRKLFLALVEGCAAKGWGEYRTHVAFQSDVMNRYAFNDNVLRRFHEKVKDAIDPNGILSPGKSGIWPKRFRDARA